MRGKGAVSDFAAHDACLPAVTRASGVHRHVGDGVALADWLRTLAITCLIVSTRLAATIPPRPPSHAAPRTATKSGAKRAAAAMLGPLREPARTTAMRCARTR